MDAGEGIARIEYLSRRARRELALWKWLNNSCGLVGGFEMGGSFGIEDATRWRWIEKLGRIWNLVIVRHHDYQTFINAFTH
jgi:hypothetical protein